jgi:hypothetical protein
MRLESVDAFEPHRVGAQVAPVGRLIAESLQVLHQTVVVGQKVDRVAVGLRSVSRQVRVQDVEITGDECVARLRHDGPLFASCSMVEHKSEFTTSC